jgi:hypothetical protein
MNVKWIENCIFDLVINKLLPKQMNSLLIRLTNLTVEYAKLIVKTELCNILSIKFAFNRA